MKIDCLDHGFVELLEVMGNDASIARAARVSYANDQIVKTFKEDQSLIRYLYRAGHTSPFEMVEFQFHIKMPIAIARQLVRHRTASMNEVSARYTELDDEWYVPDTSRIAAQSLFNKQSSGKALPEIVSAEVISVIDEHSKEAFVSYHRLLSMGVAREVARFVLPVNVYTRFYWKIDLHNLLHFISRRLHDGAQEEMQSFARAIAAIVAAICPISWTAFDDFHPYRKAMLLTRQEYEQLKIELAVLKGLPRMPAVEFPTKREEREWKEKALALGLELNE